VDGAGALLKKEFRKEQIKPNVRQLQNAYLVVVFFKEEAMRQHATHPDVKRIIHKYFWEVKATDVDRS
jgi:hypothetical protein